MKNYQMSFRLLLNCMLLLVVAGVAGLPERAMGQRKDEWRAKCNEMVELYVSSAGVKDKRVLDAMRNTPRQEFMPANVQNQAYQDAGVPIGESQTISSPFIVAYMTESIDPQPTDKVLEIGTGSGYQAAILSPLVAEVYSIEIVETLGKRAARVLKRLNYDNVTTKIGDGFLGWEEHAPFDKIIVTCSPEKVPKPLVDQLKEGGLMVIPVGERYQQTLFLLRKKDGKLEAESLRPTLFVPMTGSAEDLREVQPDPEHPVLLNGDFEVDQAEQGFIKGWYYERLLTWETDDLAPSGKHFITFKNEDPGRAAHLMQAIALTGEKIAAVKFSAAVKYSNIIEGPERNSLPVVALSFYDADRRDLGTEILGPFRGSKDRWQRLESEVRVPQKTRDVILRIGMFGATGTASFDDIELEVTKRTK
jgi:protein-L-isoaspartate(D-aspartate) O-methyltransferase